MTKYEIIMEALKLYRETELQNRVIDITLDEHTPHAWDRDKLYSTLKEYSYIDRISKTLKDVDKRLPNMCSAVRVPIGHNPTDDEYNDLIDKYNELYFALIDIIC